MTKVVVNIKDLAKYSEQLINDVTELDSIINSMVSIVNSLSTGWQGYDAENFVTNATSYLENLNIVKKAIVDSAESVQKNAVGYANRINSFYDKLGG